MGVGGARGRQELAGQREGDRRSVRIAQQNVGRGGLESEELEQARGRVADLEANLRELQEAHAQRIAELEAELRRRGWVSDSEGQGDQGDVQLCCSCSCVLFRGGVQVVTDCVELQPCGHRMCGTCGVEGVLQAATSYPSYRCRVAECAYGLACKKRGITGLKLLSRNKSAAGGHPLHDKDGHVSLDRVREMPPWENDYFRHSGSEQAKRFIFTVSYRAEEEMEVSICGGTVRAEEALSSHTRSALLRLIVLLEPHLFPPVDSRRPPKHCNNLGEFAEAAFNHPRTLLLSILRVLITGTEIPPELDAAASNKSFTGRRLLVPYSVLLQIRKLREYHQVDPLQRFVCAVLEDSRVCAQESVLSKMCISATQHTLRQSRVGAMVLKRKVGDVFACGPRDRVSVKFDNVEFKRQSLPKEGSGWMKHYVIVLYQVRSGCVACARLVVVCM